MLCFRTMAQAIVTHNFGALVLALAISPSKSIFFPSLTTGLKQVLSSWLQLFLIERKMSNLDIKKIIVCLSLCLSFFLSLFLSLCLFVSLFPPTSLCLSVFYVCFFLSMSVCLYIYVWIFKNICLFFYLCLFAFLPLFCLSLVAFSVCFSFYLCLFGLLSIFLLLSLFVCSSLFFLLPLFVCLSLFVFLFIVVQTISFGHRPNH